MTTDTSKVFPPQSREGPEPLVTQSFTENSQKLAEMHTSGQYEAADAVPEQFDVKVEQQANLASREFEIGKHLGFVNGCNLLNSLELHYHLSLDE